MHRSCSASVLTPQPCHCRDAPCPASPGSAYSTHCKSHRKRGSQVASTRREEASAIRRTGPRDPPVPRAPHWHVGLRQCQGDESIATFVCLTCWGLSVRGLVQRLSASPDWSPELIVPAASQPGCGCGPGPGCEQGDCPPRLLLGRSPRLRPGSPRRSPHRPPAQAVAALHAWLPWQL